MNAAPTVEQLTQQAQQLKDMLDLTVNQRNNAQNECLQLGAELIAAKRRIAELEKAAEGQPDAPAPRANGHDEHASAAAA